MCSRKWFNVMKKYAKGTVKRVKELRRRKLLMIATDL